MHHIELNKVKSGSKKCMIQDLSGSATFGMLFSSRFLLLTVFKVSEIKMCLSKYCVLRKKQATQCVRLLPAITVYSRCVHCFKLSCPLRSVFALPSPH